MAGPNVETLSFSFDSVDVRLAPPDVAVLNAWANFTFKANGKQMTGKNCYQDVYVKNKRKMAGCLYACYFPGMQE